MSSRQILLAYIMRSLEEWVLGCCVSVFCTVCITLLTLIRKFIYSKPPGRIMVSIILTSSAGSATLGDTSFRSRGGDTAHSN